MFPSLSGSTGAESLLAMLRNSAPQGLPSEWSHILDVCCQESERLTSLMRQLLDVGLLAAGRTLAETAPTDVRPVIDEVAAAVRERYAGKRAEFSVELPPGVCRADVDAAHLRLVLEKALDNAVKFGDKDPVRVGVRVSASPHGWLSFEVSDNGPGIPHECCDRVLDGFLQVEERATGQVPGLGVGLFMARQVVEAYGGSIRARSQLGEGVSLTFSLPAAAG